MSNPFQPVLGGKNPWHANPNLIWLASTLTLNRNLDKLKFSAKLSLERKQQVVSLISKELLESTWLKGGTLGRAEEMTPSQKEYLAERFLSNESYNQSQIGEAFVWGDSGEVLAVLNQKEHLSLLFLENQEEPEKAWEKLNRLELSLEKGLNFAFSSQFGFLTSDPMYCGTGLVVQIFLHLPTLILTDSLKELLDRHQEELISITGLQGNFEELAGDLVILYNRYTLGVSEDQILSCLHHLATTLMIEEKSLRTQVQQQTHPLKEKFKDQVSRAYAILLHSYQIELLEAMQAISLMKLGCDFGWIQNLDQTTLNALFLDVRRAHLLNRFGEDLSLDQLPHKRAEFIHHALKAATLLI